MKKNILVTGGAGFIGSHACLALQRANFVPICVDNLSTAPDRTLVKFGPFYNLDVRNTEKLTDILISNNISSVLHFAGSAYVGESHSNPGRYYNNNIMSTLSLLDAMRVAGADQLVFSSSCATYGKSITGYFDEDCTQVPESVYGRTKLFAENLIRDYCNSFNISAICLRYFNAAGADPNCLVGERHNPETHLIPLAIMSGLRLRGPLEIFGNNYDTIDGSCVRDYTHVSDLADAHLFALDYLNRVRGFHAFNLGTGKGTSVFEIIESVERAIGCTVPRVICSNRDGDPPILIANITRAQSILKWQPKYVDIDFIIKTALNYLAKDL